MCGIYYVGEGKDWVTRREGETIMNYVRLLQPDIPCTVTTDSRWLYRQIVHFGSLWSLVGNVRHTHRSNRLVATIFHGHEGMGSEMQKALETLVQSISWLEAVVTACSLMRSRLLKLGVPEEKLHVIPLGVSLQRFHPPSPEERLRQRKRLRIPEKAVCIGSFQKDGVGWGEGLKPKLIKGPDIFLEVVKRLSLRYPLFVLLTGPARGYVKRGLESAGIPYRHDYVRDYDELPAYYHCLDLYLVTSREEGGPRALPECMATGVPLISTRVGMAPDMVEQDVNGVLVEGEDVDSIVRAASRLIEDIDLRHRFRENALRTVQSYDWSVVARTCYDRIYAPLLEKR
jgi:glycosyltransferase involved in cell wall biosynthesis